MERKNSKLVGMVLLIASMGLFASAQNVKWAGGDGLWTNAANWVDGSVPTIANDTINWHGNAITLDDVGFARRYWSRHLSGNNNLIVTSGGSLTTAGDIALNEFSDSFVMAELNVNGGDLFVGNNLSVAGQDSSWGEALAVLNSGTIIVTNQMKIGTAGKESGVKGQVDVNGGTCNVLGYTIVGGGNLATDEGTLNLFGGVYNEGVSNAMQIGIGNGNGTVNLYGGMLINNNDLEMETGESNDVGTAVVNLYGGEWWQLGTTIDAQDQSEINVNEGVLYWAGDQLDAVTALVTNGYLTFSEGLTNTLTASWDASWTNTTTVNYGYWSNVFKSVLFADVDDVTNGFTTVWAYNLTPSLGLPEDTDGAGTNRFTNSGGDQLWTTAANWNIGTVPTGLDTVQFTWDGNTDTLVVASPVEALNLETGHNNTATVAVVTGGSLAVGNDADIGNGGTTGVGRLVVDGGDVSIGNELVLSRWGSGRHGMLELNSGSVEVVDQTLVGNQGAGTATINGGVFTQTNDVFKVAGGNGGGTLNVNGGLLQLHTGDDVWHPLQVGTGAGDGVVNMTGGTISTRHLVLGNNNGGLADLNLYGGTFDLAHTWTGSLFMRSEGNIHIEGGVFQWRGTDKISVITNLVAQGQMTWDNGMTNMLYESWDYSSTNGTSILYVEAANGYTTVWAFDTTSLPAGYDAFASLYDLQEGAEGDDDDDGLSNLGEYAINGNPTNASDTGQTDMSSDGEIFSYVHAKLADDSSVTYHLIDTPDLVFKTLTTNGYVSQVAGPVDGDYLMVTNNYDMTGKSQQFIELKVEQ